MVLDGAPAHVRRIMLSKEHSACETSSLLSGLNPVEHLWDEIREKEFANRVFDSLGAAIAQAARG